jgi:hypothetical protein
MRFGVLDSSWSFSVPSTSLETMFFPSEPAKVYLPSCGSPCKIKFSQDVLGG